MRWKSMRDTGPKIFVIAEVVYFYYVNISIELTRQKLKVKYITMNNKTIKGIKAEMSKDNLKASITVNMEKIIGILSPNIFGYGIEHVYRCVYDGVYDDNSKFSNKEGIRRDVIKYASELKPAVLRWPGGNFSSWYHWKDGIGHKRNRPKKLSYCNEILQEESNLFGTDEYISFCRKLGAEPYITINAGNGSPEEAGDWVEYCNGTTDTFYANLRRKNGRTKPYNVQFWEIGNEIYGDWQLGTKTVEEYGKFCLEAIKAMKRIDPTIKIIAVGMGNHDPDWDKKLLNIIAAQIDYLSVHIYIGRHSYLDSFGQIEVLNDHFKKMQSDIQSVRMKKKIVNDIKLVLSEWGIWYRKSHDEGLEEIFNLKDALVIASELNMIIRWCNFVDITTYYSLVNCISPILTGSAGLFLQSIYYPLKIFANETGHVVLAPEVISETFSCRDYRYFSWPIFDIVKDNFNLPEKDTPFMDGIPYLDVSATTNDTKTRITLIVVNRHPEQAIETLLKLPGFNPSENVSVWEINGKDIYSENRFGQENVSVKKNSLDSISEIYSFPAHSITILKFYGKCY
ncbi:MAG: hypothetical protein M1501_01535 [Candidatus Omnitrophica bacterium]|nr:hypothetical protein [Candidatus Omnitrophota bacterium]